jgi:hypothetical protein
MFYLPAPAASLFQDGKQFEVVSNHLAPGGGGSNGASEGPNNGESTLRTPSPSAVSHAIRLAKEVKSCQDPSMWKVPFNQRCARLLNYLHELYCEAYIPPDLYAEVPLLTNGNVPSSSLFKKSVLHTRCALRYMHFHLATLHVDNETLSIFLSVDL